MCRRRWAEAIDIVGAMVAPYLHISDFRQQLGLKQKCLVDCLPAEVSSSCYALWFGLLQPLLKER